MSGERSRSGVDHEQDKHDRKVSRKQYETVLSTIELNTGRAQPPLARVSSVMITATNAGLDSDTARNKLQAARENEDIVTWKDGDGRRRVALADPPDGHYVESNIDAFRDVLAVEASKPDPDEDFVEWCNTRIAAIREGTDE